MTWTHERARVARLSQTRPADHPDLIGARRDLRAARAEDYIRQLVDAAPPLTDEQLRRLSLLLRPLGVWPGRRNGHTMAKGGINVRFVLPTGVSQTA
jgi:hypothetical protein